MDRIFTNLDRLLMTKDFDARRQIVSDLKSEIGVLVIDLSNEKEKNIRLLEERLFTPEDAGS